MDGESEKPPVVKLPDVNRRQHKREHMCHTQKTPGQLTPAVDRREIDIRLSTGEQMPALDVGSAVDPGVLLIADVYGRSPFYEHLAALLADAGLRVVLPEFFFRQGPLEESSRAAAFARRSRLDQARSVEDLRDAVYWLRGLDAERDRRVGVMGFCIGGTFALALASTDADIATVAFYGFPTLPGPVASPPPEPMSLVNNLRGPVLALWGENDDTVGIGNVRRYVASATKANDAFQSEILPGLGHGFLGNADLGDVTGAVGSVWRRAVEHLTTHCGN